MDAREESWKAIHNFVDAVADTLSGGFFIWCVLSLSLPLF